MTGTTSVLQTKDLTVRYGGLTALDGVSFQVHGGARHGILGPNGAGKTTLFNAISGFVVPQLGSVWLGGQEVTGLAAHRRVHLGLARTFQITNLLPELTALENVLLGVLVRIGMFRDAWREARANERARERALEKLGQLNLDHLADARVGELGYGEQRQLEIATALSLDPKILLLDEPTAGLSAVELRGLLELINNLPEELTLVIIEHDLGVVFRVASQLTVLHYGEVIADGPAEDVRKQADVREAYLGNA